MSKVVVCDICGERLDGVLGIQQKHVRIAMTVSRLGIPDVLIERDFCPDDADERIAHFESAPFVNGLTHR